MYMWCLNLKNDDKELLGEKIKKEIKVRVS